MATQRTVKLMPFLWYAKDAEGAAKFYVSIFPDSHVDRIAAMQNESPSGPPGSVKVVEFTLFGQPMQAMSAGKHHEFNDAMSLMVECEDQAEIDRYWKALAKGGEEVACGWVTDRYGVRWQIVPRELKEMMASKDKAAAKRAGEAMMKMVKLDIAKLQAAFDGEEEGDAQPATKRRRTTGRSTEARARR